MVVVVTVIVKHYMNPTIGFINWRSDRTRYWLIFSTVFRVPGPRTSGRRWGRSSGNQYLTHFMGSQVSLPVLVTSDVPCGPLRTPLSFSGSLFLHKTTKLLPWWRDLTWHFMSHLNLHESIPKSGPRMFPLIDLDPDREIFECTICRDGCGSKILLTRLHTLETTVHSLHVVEYWGFQFLRRTDGDGYRSSRRWPFVESSSIYAMNHENVLQCKKTLPI